MALRNRPFSGHGRYAPPSLKQRTVCLDKRTREDIIAIIENLNHEKWKSLTQNLDNITRVEFARVCLGIVQHLTDATYKKSKLFNSSQSTECPVQSTKPSARPSVSPLQSPQESAAIAEIALEAKLALLAALESLEVSISDPAEGWSAVFLQLEEETSNILTASLDASDFFARITSISCSSDKDVQMDAEVKASTDLAECPEKNASESENQLENAEAASNGVEEPVISSKEEEEEVTTMCTNEVISQIFDAYKSDLEEEERLRAAKEREEEVSLLTSHVVDSVMTQLKELTSSGKPVAFCWVPRDVHLPAAGQRVFSPQFEMAAAEKVSEVLMLSEAKTGEAPESSVPSMATDIVGSVVRGLSNLTISLGSFRSAANGLDTASTAQNIYHSVQYQVRSFLWGKRTSAQDLNSQISDGSLSYDTESSDGTIEYEDEDDDEEEEEEEEETSMENETSEENLHLKASKNEGVPLIWRRSKESRMKVKHSLPEVTLSRSKGGYSSEQKIPKRKADLELDVTINQCPRQPQTTPASRAPQPAGVPASVGYLRKLVCCIHVEDQTKDEDLTNVTQEEALHISKSHVSDIVVIMQRERSSSESSVDSAPGRKTDVQLDPGESSQCPGKKLFTSRLTQPMSHMPHIDSNTRRDCLRKFMCCLKADDQVKAETDNIEAETSSAQMSETHMSDIILILDREGASPESSTGYKQSNS